MRLQCTWSKEIPSFNVLHSFYIQARETMSAMLNIYIYIATTLYTYIAHAATTTYNSLPMHMNVHYTHRTTHYTVFHNPPMHTTNKHILCKYSGALRTGSSCFASAA